MPIHRRYKSTPGLNRDDAGPDSATRGACFHSFASRGRDRIWLAQTSPTEEAVPSNGINEINQAKGGIVRMPVQRTSWSDLPDIVTVGEASAFLRIPKNGIYEAIKLGVLPAINAGKRRTRIAKAVLQKTFGVPVEAARMTAAFGHNPEANWK